ncbi:MAG: hypothetical protein QOC82_1953 [Frankiaceae bacterium]|nr:hypothetical protein [Frankiaceae bacterium]
MASGIDEMYWHATWLPFMVAGAERLYVDCAGPSSAVSPVRLVSSDWEDFATERTPSLTAAVEMWVQALDAGHYHWSEADGHWICDYSALPSHWRTSGLF